MARKPRLKYPRAIYHEERKRMSPGKQENAPDRTTETDAFCPVVLWSVVSWSGGHPGPRSAAAFASDYRFAPQRSNHVNWVNPVKCAPPAAGSPLVAALLPTVAANAAGRTPQAANVFNNCSGVAAFFFSVPSRQRLCGAGSAGRFLTFLSLFFHRPRSTEISSLSLRA